MTTRWPLAALLGLAAGCGPRTQPCVSTGGCGEGYECLANRCVVAGGEPVAPGLKRLVMEPEELALVQSSAPRSPSLPAAIPLGAKLAGDTVLYLRFAPRWRQGRVRAAFLLLHPEQTGPRDASDVPVRVWRVGESWSAADVSWLHQPRRVPPSTRGLARPAPAQPLRIDVTEIVRYLAEQPPGDHGLALVASAGPGHGARFGSGAGGTAGPRLELYLE